MNCRLVVVKTELREKGVYLVLFEQLFFSTSFSVVLNPKSLQPMNLIDNCTCGPGLPIWTPSMKLSNISIFGNFSTFLLCRKM